MTVDVARGHAAAAAGKRRAMGLIWATLVFSCGSPAVSPEGAGADGGARDGGASLVADGGPGDAGGLDGGALDAGGGTVEVPVMTPWGAVAEPSTRIQ